jgi:hypothetical protein
LIPRTGDASAHAAGDDPSGICGKGKGNMRHIRTIMLFALPIAFGALLGKYGLSLGLDGSGTNFTW